MPLVTQRLHLPGLRLAQQQKVYMLRKTKIKNPKGKMKTRSWEKIAKIAVNLKGKRPNWKLCSEVFKRLSTTTGHVAYKYANCGRKSTLTPALRQWLISRLLALRTKCVCTSTTLQRELAQTQKVKIHASAIRKFLSAEGYKWLLRIKTPKYSEDVKAERRAFARRVLALTPAQMKAEVRCCLDGVVFVIPPKNVVSRENFCRGQDTHIWRKPGEGASPELAGHDNYPKQAPPDRCIPLWGGAGPGGFAPVFWHATRKITSEQWAEVVRDGKLPEALRSVNLGKTRGPWGMLCDNETFLRARPSRVAHERKNITIWEIPAKSPDLNPVEKFWAWTRVYLRNMDMKDLVAKRQQQAECSTCSASCGSLKAVRPCRWRGTASVGFGRSPGK